MSERRPFPDAIKNAPVLTPGLELYYNAYEELVSFQTINPERPPILWADVHEYATWAGLDEEQRATLLRCVVEMELVSIKHKQSKAKRGKGNGGNNPKATVPTHPKAKPQLGRKR